VVFLVPFGRVDRELFLNDLSESGHSQVAIHEWLGCSNSDIARIAFTPSGQDPQAMDIHRDTLDIYRKIDRCRACSEVVQTRQQILLCISEPKFLFRLDGQCRGGARDSHPPQDIRRRFARAPFFGGSLCLQARMYKDLNLVICVGAS
jgi:hypothetical protein